MQMFSRLFDPVSPIRPRIVAVYLGLIVTHIVVWGWALIEFKNSSLLMGSALLAYVLGLRHAVDPDHIAAIDNVTRKLMQEGQRPVSVGLWFALGHSSMIIVAASAIAVTAASLDGTFAEYKEIGSIFSTMVSAVFLLLIAVFNLIVLRNIWMAYRQVKRTGKYSEGDFNTLLNNRGFLARFLRPLFKLISRSWHMLPLGLLFALGFDTATEISIFGLSAVEASKGVSLWSILVFPALFTAGMTLIDTTDGILMLGAYGWAFVDPIRKLFYNLTITFVSVLVAVFIGSIEALGLISEKLKLEGWFWDAIGAVNAHFSVLGFVIIGLFAVAWVISLIVFKLGRFHEIEVVAGE